MPAKVTSTSKAHSSPGWTLGAAPACALAGAVALSGAGVSSQGTAPVFAGCCAATAWGPSPVLGWRGSDPPSAGVAGSVLPAAPS